MIPQSYTTLTNEGTQWLVCSHGRAQAVGWRGDSETREKCYNLIANFDYDDRRPDRPAPQHIPLTETLSFAHTTHERLKTALNRFFYLNILHDREVPVFTTWDEEAETFTVHQDEEGARRLADWATRSFITDHIKTESFVPAMVGVGLDEVYGLTTNPRFREDGD